MSEREPRNLSIWVLEQKYSVDVTTVGKVLAQEGYFPTRHEAELRKEGLQEAAYRDFQNHCREFNARALICRSSPELMTEEEKILQDLLGPEALAVELSDDWESFQQSRYYKDLEVVELTPGWLTFRAALVGGVASIEDDDEWVERWHRDSPAHISLQEWMGMTTKEYDAWARHGSSVLPFDWLS